MAALAYGPCRLLPARFRLSSISSSTRRARLCTCLSSDRKVEPPNVAQLCEKARLTLTPKEVEEFGLQIGRIVDWFAQLQDVDLENISPAIRVGDVDGTTTLRADVPRTFPDREAMLGGAPELEGPYIKVPKILKENQE